MKQVGKCLVGNYEKINDYTSSWYNLSLHPSVFYRKHDVITGSLENISGLYTELDHGSLVSLRFSDSKDFEQFHKMYLEVL